MTDEKKDGLSRLETVELSWLRPDEKNPRRNDEAAKAVAESIRQCGYIAPIICDEAGAILAGHTRYKALLLLGRKSAQALIRPGLSEEQKRKYRLLDNKTGELADWDLELLGQALDGLDFGTLDLDWGLPKEKETREDDYDQPLPAESMSKTGDLYLLGRHRLLVGDSTKPEDVARLMNGRQADMLLTDPPYNVNLGNGGSADEARKRHRRTDGLVIANDCMPDAEFREFLQKAFANARDVMKPGAAFYIWHADNESYNFRGACIDCGLQIRQCLIWAKNAITLGRQDFQWKHEPCLYGWKSGGAHCFLGDRKQPTILQFDKPSASKIHPTMKPVMLFDYQIKCSAKPGEIVLDLFAGSGTAIIAAEQNGRTAYAMEYDPRYADAIIDRWEKLTGMKSIKLSERDAQGAEGN